MAAGPSFACAPAMPSPVHPLCALPSTGAPALPLAALPMTTPTPNLTPPPAAVSLSPLTPLSQAVDLASLVALLRQQRMGMVQTRDQYVFCHTALLAFVRQLDAERAQQQAQQQQLPEG